MESPLAKSTTIHAIEWQHLHALLLSRTLEKLTLYECTVQSQDDNTCCGSKITLVKWPKLPPHVSVTALQNVQGNEHDNKVHSAVGFIVAGF